MGTWLYARNHRSSISLAFKPDKEPLTLAEAEQLKNWSERIFAIAVCSIPHLEVYHEPRRVANKQGATLPDFLIRNKRRGQNATDIYIEVTGAKELTGYNKRKQKRVMVTEGRNKRMVRYLQLPRKIIEQISCAKKIELKLSVCRRAKIARELARQTR